MKRILLISCFIFFGATICFAQSFRRHALEIGSEVYQFKYDEPRVMGEEGLMSGFYCSYTYHGWLYPSAPELTSSLARIEARFASGEVDYENSGILNDIDDYTIEVRGLLGYDFEVSIASFLTPYVGVGYRYLNDDMGGLVTSTGAYGYERESNYVYSPIGIEYLVRMGRDWSFGINAEGDVFWWGEQVSHLSDVSSVYNDLENKQNKGYGLRGSVKLEKNSETFDFIIEPFIRYWNIKKSEEEVITVVGLLWGYGWEPKNNTTEFGCRIALRF
ncbi:MAG: hypothetical protein DRP74_09265 [Candidatus Omnitrophota bacterium]|nr:MAG: hypothetical protein DRP74_09265 [Candidatus Omnitrophota bacterium]